MNKSEFAEAKKFIIADVEREIKLAYVTNTEEGKKSLTKHNIPLGGGNFLAALGLLSYTEFGGKLKYNKMKPNGFDWASENFNLFFDDLGPSYRAFRNSGVNVYDIFRCGLVHEYFTKQTCTINMCSNNRAIGIGTESNGKFFFEIETYFKDLKKALDDLEMGLYGIVT